MNFIFSVLSLSLSMAALANTHTARIVKLENSSEVFIPGENKEGGFKHVKYLDGVYHIVSATKGMKLENGYIITTGPTSKAKVVYNNGDHFFISENTQYQIDWKRESNATTDPSAVNLLRGAIRGLIQKDGPRSGMKVKTKYAVMGIRGTDFYINDHKGGLNVSVIRGEVEILNEIVDDKPAKVQAGQTLVKLKTVNKFTTTTKEDLQQIALGSTISVSSEEKTKPEVTQEISQLENKATEVTLNDIKEYQPLLYKSLTQDKKGVGITSDSLALNTVKMLEQSAPSKIKKKPGEADLEENSDPYDKYKFKK